MGRNFDRPLDALGVHGEDSPSFRTLSWPPVPLGEHRDRAASAGPGVGDSAPASLSNYRRRRKKKSSCGAIPTPVLTRGCRRAPSLRPKTVQRRCQRRRRVSAPRAPVRDGSAERRRLYNGRLCAREAARRRRRAPESACASAFLVGSSCCSPSPASPVAAPAGELHVGVPARPGESRPGGRDGAVPAPGDAASLPGPRRVRRARRHRARARDGVDRLPRRARLDLPAPPGRPASRRHAARARRGRRGPRRADLRRRAAGRRAPWVRPFRGAGADRPRGAARRGRLDPDRRSAQPYAPLLALLAHPGLAVAVARPGGPRVGSGPVPGRRAHAGPADAGGGAGLARGAAAERPPGPARGRGRRGGSRRARARRSAPCGAGRARLRRGPRWASRSCPARPGGSDSWRFGPTAGLTSRKTVRQAVALALDPALLQSGARAGGRRRTPPGCRPARGPCATRARSLFDPDAGAAPAGAGRAGRPDADAARVGPGLGARGRRASPRRSGSRWAPRASGCRCGWSRRTRPTAPRGRARRS